MNIVGIGGGGLVGAAWQTCHVELGFDARTCLQDGREARLVT